MARPQKQTVEYFSHDVDASEGKTMTIIEGEFGPAGFAFWFKLLERLGKTEGHYYDATDEENLEFLCRKLQVDLITGTKILDKLSKLNAIDPILWEHRVIWSQNFVERLVGVYKKRDRPLPQKPCFCNGNCNHSVALALIPVTETPIPTPEMQQSKVKYSKVKYIGDVEKSTSLQEEVKNIFEGLKSRRDYNSSKATAEASAIRWMLKQGYKVEQVLACYDFMQKDAFWEKKELFMMSVKNEIGNFVKKQGQMPSPFGGKKKFQTD